MGIGQGLFLIKAFREGTAAAAARHIVGGGFVSSTIDSDVAFVWGATATLVQRWSGTGYVSASVALPGGINLFQSILFPDGTSAAILSFSTPAATSVQTVTLNLEAIAKMSTLTGPPVITNSYRHFVDAFIGGGRIQVTLGPHGTLRLHLRALLTGDYLLEGNTLKPAHYPLSYGTANNCTFIDGEDDSSFALGLSSYSLPSSVVPLGAITGLGNDITLDVKDAAPKDVSSNVLPLSVRRYFSGDVSDPSVNATSAVCVVPIQIHVPTELIIVLDRSESMSSPGVGSQDKWAVATSIVNLTTKLYNHLIPDRTSTSGSLRSKFSVKLGQFAWTRRTENAVFEPILPGQFEAATSMPDLADGLSASGGTAIGAALISAARHFNVGAPWARRIVVLLTDGIDNSAYPTVSTINNAQFPPLDGTPADGASISSGVILHSISYAKTVETSVMQLEALALAHNGVFQETASAVDSNSREALLTAFMSLLPNIVPAAHSQVLGNSIQAESGLDRLILVTTKEPVAPLVAVTDPSGTQAVVAGTTASQGSGFGWIVIDKPVRGVEYGLQTVPVGANIHAFYDLSVRSRFGIVSTEVGKPLRLWAEILCEGQPVIGAHVRAALSAPAESQGALLSEFVREGGIATAIARKTLDPVALTAALHATNISIPKAQRSSDYDLTQASGSSAAAKHLAVPESVRAEAILPGHQELGDPSAVAAQLLGAVEADRNLGFQYCRRSLLLNEVVAGRYEIELPAESVDFAGIYCAELRIDGRANNYPFARNHRLSTFVTDPPAEHHSPTSLVQSTSQPGTWFATVTPMNSRKQPLGPGLTHFATFHHLDVKLRNDPNIDTLITVDNLDGSYSTELRLPAGEIPKIAWFYGNPDQGAPAIAVQPDRRDLFSLVRVTLDQIKITSDHDPLWKGKGELVFSTVVASSASPTRAVRMRLPARGHYEASSGAVIAVKQVIFEGVVENASRLTISIVGEELDWPRCLDKNDPLVRYSRSISVTDAAGTYGPRDEPNDPERLSDWQVWYTIDVR